MLKGLNIAGRISLYYSSPKCIFQYVLEKQPYTANHNKKHIVWFRDHLCLHANDCKWKHQCSRSYNVNHKRHFFGLIYVIILQTSLLYFVWFIKIVNDHFWLIYVTSKPNHISIRSVKLMYLSEVKSLPFSLIFMLVLFFFSFVYIGS